MKTPDFLFSRESKGEEADQGYFLPRQSVQILRFEVPRLKPEELVQAISFKLRAVYPAHHDQIQFLVHWVPRRNHLVAFVLVFSPEEYLLYQPLIEAGKLYTSFPLALPPALGRDAILIQNLDSVYELYVYTGGILVQSHVVALGQEAFSQLVRKIRSEHPEHRLIRISSSQNRETWSGEKPDQEWDLREIFHARYFPRLRLERRPPLPWGLWTLRSAVGFVALVALILGLLQQVGQQDRTLESLKQELNVLLVAAGGSSGLKEKVESLQKRLASLKKSQGEPLWEVAVRIQQAWGQSVRLTSMSLRDGRLRLQGRSVNAIRSLEKLRKDPWFLNLAPVAIRSVTGSAEDEFLFEGGLNREP